MTYQKAYLTSRRQRDNSMGYATKVRRPDQIIPTGVGHAVLDDADLTLCGRSFNASLVYPTWPGAAPTCHECLELAAARTS
jgi:hypothetical protein